MTCRAVALAELGKVDGPAADEGVQLRVVQERSQLLCVLNVQRFQAHPSALQRRNVRPAVQTHDGTVGPVGGPSSSGTAQFLVRARVSGLKVAPS